MQKIILIKPGRGHGCLVCLSMIMILVYKIALHEENDLLSVFNYESYYSLLYPHKYWSGSKIRGSAICPTYRQSNQPKTHTMAGTGLETTSRSVIEIRLESAWHRELCKWNQQVNKNSTPNKLYAVITKNRRRVAVYFTRLRFKRKLSTPFELKI